MPMPAKIGDVCTSASGLHHVQVVGYYQLWDTIDVANKTGMLVMPVGKITSGIHHRAISIAQWAAEGFRSDSEQVAPPAPKRRVVRAVKPRLKTNPGGGNAPGL